MVPTWTMLGRVAGPCPVLTGWAGIADAVATGAIMACPAPGARPTPRRSSQPSRQTAVARAPSRASPGVPVRRRWQRDWSDGAGEGCPYHERHERSRGRLACARGRRGPAARQACDRCTLLLYSDDVTTRDAVRLGVGRRPARTSRWPRGASAPLTRLSSRRSRRGHLRCARSSTGKPRPTGGMGLCRQLKNEIYDCPPILVLTGRVQDGWLAAWSRPTSSSRTRSTRSRWPSAVAELGRSATHAPEMAAATGPWPGPTSMPRLLAGRGSRPGRERVGDGPDHGRGGHPGAGGRLPRRPAGQGRDRRGDARPGRVRCSRTRSASTSPSRVWTSSAPAATGPTR